MRARIYSGLDKLASLLPERLEEPVRRHFAAWSKFSLIGGLLTGVQIVLQTIEKHYGWDILWLSPLQGTVLANIGLVLNKFWTFRERRLPWAGILVCWNLQKIPHSLASWGLFALLLQVPFIAYWAATLLTAMVVGIGSFWASTAWSLRPREPEAETA